MVAFETLKIEDIELAVHHDIEDEDQTVEYPAPEIKTSAKDSETGTNKGYASAVEKVTIVDEIKISGLKPGMTYTITGKLIDKDASTEDKIVYIDGVEETLEFTAEEGQTEATIEMTFEVDAAKVLGKSVVVAETLFLGDWQLADHTEPEDKDQTVDYPAPVIRTVATGGYGEKELKADEDGNAVVIDTITYENFKPGTKVVFSGVIMNKSTGKVFEDGDGPVKAESEIIDIEKDSGTVTVKFTIKGINDFRGLELVVFEKAFLVESVEEEVTVTDEDGNETKSVVPVDKVTDKLIASHEDIDDENQAVKTPEPDVPKTGDTNNIFRWVAVFMGSIECIFLVLLKKRKKNKA